VKLSSDYRELFKTLNRHKVRYLVIGAYAVIYYTEPRYTKDLDIWVSPDKDNSKRVYDALKDFGAPLEAHGITKEFFTQKNMVYQLGVAPVRVDILMDVEGQNFDDCWKKRKIDKWGKIYFPPQ